MRFVGPCNHQVRVAPNGETHCFERTQTVPQEYASVDPIAALIMGVPMDINTAPAGALRLVSGIGFHLSNRIVAHRRSQGAFGSLKDLEDVKGIGPKLRQRLAWFARVNP